MSDENPAQETVEAQKVQGEIEKTVDQIERQEEKLDNARTVEDEKKESQTLQKLLDRFDTLTAKLESIDKRLSEPTVPAPAAKTEETPKTDDEPAGDASDMAEKPRKRRLGAW